MNDRYLFKAKRIDNGEWVEGNLVNSVYHKNDVCVGTYGSNVGMHEVDISTICQCTGLKDKNGKLIWENDIINTDKGKAVVIWDKAEWRIKWIKDTIWRKDLHFWTNEDDWKCKAIGNKFDNPELLEECDND